MTEMERIERDLVRDVMKYAVMNNPNLTSAQKQKALNDIENAAMKASLVLEFVDFLNHFHHFWI